MVGKKGKRLNMQKALPIRGGNWNNSANAGVFALNCLGQAIDQGASLFYTPFSKGVSNALKINTELCSPSFWRVGFTMRRNIDRSAFVPILLGLISPLAVFMAIVAVIVYAVYGVFWARWKAHIIYKSIKRSQPGFADLDTSSSVVFIKRRVGVGASLLHGIPSTKQRVSFCGIRFLRAKTSSHDCFDSEATARLGAAVNQIDGGNILDIATITQAPPCNPAMFVSLPKFGDKQFTKSFAVQVYELTHNLTPLKTRANYNINKGNVFCLCHAKHTRSSMKLLNPTPLGKPVSKLTNEKYAQFCRGKLRDEIDGFRKMYGVPLSDIRFRGNAA
jgi:hypothetical protein